MNNAALSPPFFYNQSSDQYWTCLKNLGSTMAHASSVFVPWFRRSVEKSAYESVAELVAFLLVMVWRVVRLDLQHTKISWNVYQYASLFITLKRNLSISRYVPDLNNGHIDYWWLDESTKASIKALYWLLIMFLSSKVLNYSHRLPRSQRCGASIGPRQTEWRWSWNHYTI